MFVKAVLLAEEQLYQVFQMYQSDFQRATQNNNKNDSRVFGLYFFNQLRSQVDI
jgi:hypothetical protein